MPGQILTAVEAAQRLGYGRMTVGRLCENGRLVGAYRAGSGSHWRIPLAAVEAYRAGVRGFIRRRIAQIAQIAQIER
jgi:excisionase family DNA binding protein